MLNSRTNIEDLGPRRLNLTSIWHTSVVNIGQILRFYPYLSKICLYLSTHSSVQRPLRPRRHVAVHPNIEDIDHWDTESDVNKHQNIDNFIILMSILHIFVHWSTGQIHEYGTFYIHLTHRLNIDLHSLNIDFYLESWIWTPSQCWHLRSQQWISCSKLSKFMKYW